MDLFRLKSFLLLFSQSTRPTFALFFSGSFLLILFYHIFVFCVMPPKKPAKQEPPPESAPVDVVEEEGNGEEPKELLHIDNPALAEQALALESLEEIEK
jgi:hypothetical protein